MRRQCSFGEECAEKVQYEFRGEAETRTWWCESHVNVYIKRKLKQMDDENAARAEARLRDDVERAVQVKYTQMRQERFEAEVREKVRGYTYAHARGDLWDMVTCGCQPGKQRTLAIHDGMGVAWCSNCNSLMGRFGILEARIDSPATYYSDHTYPLDPAGVVKYTPASVASFTVALDLGQCRKLQGIAPAPFGPLPVQQHYIEQDRALRQSQKIDTMFGVQPSDRLTGIPKHVYDWMPGKGHRS